MRQRIGWLLAGLGLGALLWNVGPALAQLSVSGNLFDMTDRTARAVGRVFLRNPGDTANMGDATTPVRTDPTGTTTQPVSAASLPLPTGAATETTLGTRAADATITNRLPAGSTPADNESNAVTTSRLGAWLWIFDGTTWDRWTGAVTATDLDIRNLAAATDKIDVGQINGVAPSMGNGASGTGVQRVTLADDSTGEVRITDDAGNQIPSSTAAPAGTARGLHVRPIIEDPCSNEAHSYFPVDIVTATTVLVATGVVGQHVYICGLNLITAGANNVAIVAGTGPTCTTSTAGMNGGVTAAEGWNLAANGGLVMANAGHAQMRTETTGDSACIITSAAVQLSGTITYVIE